MVRRLKEVNPELIVMEATGGYEVAVVEALDTAGLPAVALNARQVRDFAKATGVLQKTDKIDALVLAQFAQKIKPPLRPVKDAKTRELASLINRRAQLLVMLTAENNRLKAPAVSARVRKQIQEHIEWLHRQLDQINHDLDQMVKQDPVWSEKARLLQSVPGVGPVLVWTLIAHLNELGFLNRKQIAKLCGLAPLNRDSGQYRGRRCVWGGRARVREVLYMAALVATRWNPVIKAMYERLRSKCKTFKVAITACMRKLLTILNAMMKNGTPWNMDKVNNS